MRTLYAIVAIYALAVLGLLIATMVESKRAADASVELNVTIQQSVTNIDKAVTVIKDDIAKLVEYLKQLFPPE